MESANSVDIFSFGLLELTGHPGSPFMIGLKLFISGFFDLFFML